LTIPTASPSRVSETTTNGFSVSPTIEFEPRVTIGILLALLMGALDNFVALTALLTSTRPLRVGA